MARERILTVEDNPANMLLVSEILLAEGYEVIQAATGQEGLVLARAIAPSLILLDVQLPGMDGYAVLAELKANPLTQQIPVVALTAYARPEDVKQGQEAGFSGYITKPIGTQGFRELIRGILAKEKEHGPRNAISHIGGGR